MTDDPITLPPPGELETWPMACDEDVKAYALAAVLADRAEREGPTLPGPEGPTIPADEGPDDDQRKGGPPEVTRAMLLAAEGIFRKNGVEFSPCLAGEVWRAMQAARAAAPAVWGKRYKNLPELMTLWKTGRMTGDEAMAELFKHLSSDPCAAAPAKGGSREAAWRAFAGEYEQVERLRALLREARDYVSETVQRNRESWGDRLMHKQQIDIDQLARIDAELKP